MTLLRRWEPLENMTGMRRVMDRLLHEGPFQGFDDAWARGCRAPLDIYQTEDKLVVKAFVPGIDPEDVHIAIQDGALTIKGEAKREEKTEERNYFVRERRYGSFSRAVSLPSGLDVDNADASFENGVLTLTIPKAEEARPKEIKVRKS